MQLGLSEKQLKEVQAHCGATIFDVSMKTLVNKKLVRRLSTYTDLEFFRVVRVIPKATGVGSVDKEHALRLIVKPNFGVMNPLDYAIWTMWDGKATLMAPRREGPSSFRSQSCNIVRDR